MSAALIDAARAALNYLDCPRGHLWPVGTTHDIIAGLREALAAAEAQPKSKAGRVHALVNVGHFPGMSEAFDAHMGAECWTDPDYAPDASAWAAAWKASKAASPAAPAQVPQPLSDAQLAHIWDDALDQLDTRDQLRFIARAIEAAHGIKGTT